MMFLIKFQAKQITFEVLSVPPIFHMDSSGLQWTLSTAKSTQTMFDWSGVEWSGVHVESIWTFITIISPPEWTGVQWSPVESTGLCGNVTDAYLIYEKKCHVQGLNQGLSKQESTIKVLTINH